MLGGGLFKNTEDTPVIVDDAVDVVPTEKKNCDKKKVVPKKKSDGQISNHEASKKSKGETSNADKHPTTVEDLMESNTATYTFISDKQKGLVNALETHFPESEHRFCVMHLDHNMKIQKQTKGIGVTRQMWLAAKSTTDYFFNMNMDILKKNPQEELGQEGEDGVLKWEPKKPKCSHCNEEGHNSRTCISKKTDQETNKTKRCRRCSCIQGEIGKASKSQRDICAQKSAAKSPLKKTKTVNHGGVVKPFKAPAHAGPSGVEYFETNGQNVTTLKQLQFAIRKKKSNMKKKV
ncbi:hypothetical protein POM88_018581 [Heracleum sosnowskyi]|uniref:MULE transposase domain-containing protein n=1 Tax=Heracleum sosnowskyi TaxID=360622 RepID=A0AAD8IST8_9APIA|nr:hypothetical protein POM88_018581 [Heracleum sosnowskyi]